MKRALILLVACGKSDPPPPPPPPPKPIVADAARTWPVAPAPTIPIDVTWSIADIEPLEAGVRVDDVMVYGITNPTSYPRLFVTGVDLATLETAWGKLARDHTSYAIWWNPVTRVRARFDVPHPTPSKGRGLEIAPYTPLLDRVANLDELMIEGKSVVPPGEWDPLPITIAIDGKRLRFTTRVDAPPVDEAAVLAKLREIWGEPMLLVDGAAYGKGRVLVRRIEPQRVEITYVAP